MRKKIGIVTLFGTKNYGNRLQNLAVQTCLTKRGFSVESIVWKPSRLKWRAYPLYVFFKAKVKKDPEAKRTHRFLHFNSRYCPTRFIYSKNRSIPTKIRDGYDYFITGSDQVWNTNSFGKDTFQDELSLYFLKFAKDAQKVCICPSIGIAHFKDEHVEAVRQALQGFRYLSCREKQGADELNRITGRSCEWLIDPTLCVTREEWLEILSIQQKQRKNPYLLLFFLDGMSTELEQFIREYAAGRYEIINPSDPASPWYSIDPSAFVLLLSEANMVFTDSFHVTAFSINFQVPFYVFNRIKSRTMTSRIESICELFQLQSRYILEQKPFEILEKCDFGPAERQLVVEREKFEAYLDKCFET